MNKYFLPYAFFKGSIVNSEKAAVPIMTNALQYGNAFFAGVRGYYNKEKRELSIFRLSDHYKRFTSSAKIIGVRLDYSIDDLVLITQRLAQKNNPKTNVYFRPFAYASSLNLSPNLDEDKSFDFALYMVPLGDYLPTNKGISVCVSSWRRSTDNAIPSRAKISGLYINSSLARKEAAERGFDEAIFLGEDGHVTEGSAENFFMVRDGILITPPVYGEILEGITRKTILQLAVDLGIKTQERPIDRSELYICDEAFFSGTGVQVSWIAHVDGRMVGDGKRGPITQKLQNLYFRVVQGLEQKYELWYTKIKIK